MSDDDRSLARWRELRSEPFADCRVFSVARKTCFHPTMSKEADFFVIHSSDWVNTIALTPEGKMVLVKQYRFGAGDFSLEIPGGMIDGDEGPVAAAERELREETGYIGRRARAIGVSHPNPAIQSNRCHFVLIEDARPEAATEWDNHEEIATSLVEVDDALDLVRNGDITHALVIDAFFFFLPYWEKMRKPG